MTAITLESLHQELIKLSSSMAAALTFNKEAMTKSLTFNKEALDFNETAQYIKQSRSYLYKLTSQGLIPHYKPNGKKLYFKRSELNEWMLRNKSYSSDELEQKAVDHMVGGSK